MGDSNAAVIERYRKAVESGDMGQLASVLDGFAADDFVEEWPQSGERIVGLEAFRKINQGYEGATGNAPKMVIRRITGSGDLYVVEGTIDYGDGVPVSYVGISEFRDGKVAKLTEYFANPFEAPAWRADMVERMEPVKV
jgi:ketosteroid isomerase-like protein